MTHSELFAAAGVESLFAWHAHPTEATYTAPDGSTSTLTILKSEEWVDDEELATGGRRRTRRCEATVTADSDSQYGGLEAVHVKGRLTIDGVDWAVARVVGRSESLVNVELARHEPTELTREQHRR